MLSTYHYYQPAHSTRRYGRPRLIYVIYIKRMTGMRTDELVEMSRDREAWCVLVVACIDPQPPD